MLQVYRSYVGNQWVVFDNLVRGEFDLMPDARRGAIAEFPLEPVASLERMVLVDKTPEGRLWSQARHLKERYESAAPVEARPIFEQKANDLWYHLLFAHNYLQRGDFYAGRGLLDTQVKHWLVHMMRLKDGNTQYAWRWMPRQVERDLSPAMLAALRAATCRYEPADIWRAWRETVLLAREVCRQSGWNYPAALAERLAELPVIGQ